MIIHILEELRATTKSTEKKAILESHKDNLLFQDVLYNALSPRVKFWLKQIPDYTFNINTPKISLDEALDKLVILSERVKTGAEAKAYLAEILSSLELEDAQVIVHIIEGDLKIGCNRSTVNKVWKKHIEVTPYMGAISFNEPKARALCEKGTAYSQIKMDGRYANLVKDYDESIRMESRAGEPTLLRGIFDDAVLDMPAGWVLNGELTIPGIDRYTSNGIISALRSMFIKEANGVDFSKDEAKFIKKHGAIQPHLDSIIFTAWDAITLEEYHNNKSATPYHERLSNVIKFVDEAKVVSIETTPVQSYDDAMLRFNQALLKGEEGTILKDPYGTWKHGKPAWQIKMKIEFECDLKIVGFNEGTKGSNREGMLGSLICESADGLVKTNPGGANWDVSKEIWDNRDKYMNMIVPVTCSGLSQASNGEYSLLHPRFDEPRDDKKVADTLETIKEIEEMVKGLSK